MPTEFHQQARACGFDAVGITAASLPPQWAERLQGWLDSGAHGEMTWLAQRVAERAHPQALWPAARSVIMVGMNYAPSRPYAEIPNHCGRISDYATHQDYHEVMKRRLKAYARWLVEHHGGDVKVFVDTAPVLEKPLAQQAGLGWLGRNSLLVSRSFGCYLFLGAVFTTLELPPDAPAEGHCGRCRACVDACPTAALDGQGGLEARRCLSYLTIEYKNDIPDEFHAALGNRVYGCDACVRACPWNKFAPPTPHPEYHADPQRVAVPLDRLAALEDEEFRNLFRKSPVKRIGVGQFVRNVGLARNNQRKNRESEV